MSAQSGSSLIAPGSVAPVAPPFSFLWNFRLIPRIDTYPAVLAFAQTLAGKAAILGLFGLGLYIATDLHYLHNPRWIVQFCFLVVMTALPQYRRTVLTVCTLLWTFGVWWRWADHLWLVLAAISLGSAALLFWLASHFRDSWLGRRPVACLLTGFALSVL